MGGPQDAENASLGSQISGPFSLVHLRTTISDIAKQLAALRPKIEKFMSIGGMVGLPLGILHHGKPVSTEITDNEMYRDVCRPQRTQYSEGVR